MTVCEIGAEVQTKSPAAAHEVHSQVAEAALFQAQTAQPSMAVRKLPTLVGKHPYGQLGRNGHMSP